MKQEKVNGHDNDFKAAMVCCETNEQDILKQLGQNEDERIRNSIIKFLIDVNNCAYTMSELEIASWIAWLKKQNNKSEEYVFNPMPGCTIDEAAEQAVDKVANGENIVISFNGFYMKIYKETTIDDIINSYNDFCKKQCEKNSKWSYEDKKNIETTISFLKDFADKGYENAVACIDWLKYFEQRMEE